MAAASVEDKYVAGNREYFDKDAAKYDDRPMALKLARKVKEFVVTKYPFDEETTVLLDFACGTGLLCRELAPHCKQIVGVDISQGMVDVFNTRVANQGIDPDEMKAVCLDLKGAEGELEGVKFDVVVCSAAYHHFSSIEDVTKNLVSHLKPGGKLMVIDLVLDPSRTSENLPGHGDEDHHHDHAHHHHSHEYTQSSSRSHSHQHHHLHEPSAPTPDPKLSVIDNDGQEPELFQTPPANVVAHKGGFTRETIEKVFLKSGLNADVDWSILGQFQPLRDVNPVDMFLAIGTKL